MLLKMKSQFLYSLHEYKHATEMPYNMLTTLLGQMVSIAVLLHAEAKIFLSKVVHVDT